MTTSPLRPALRAAASALALGAAPALADVALPAPYVSRALDAVLLPIDADVRAAFELAGDDAGLLVLATEPGGVADANGVLPGDVIHMVGGQKVARPVEVDEVVYAWILEGVFDFDFGVYRDGGYIEVVSFISEESYWEVVDVAVVETWSSWEASSFSYEEYYAEYAEEIAESYEASETLIEETVASAEAFEEGTEEDVEEASEEEHAEDEAGDDDLSEDGSEDRAGEDGDEEWAEEADDESYDEAEAEEEADEEEAYDDADEAAEEDTYEEADAEGGDEASDEGDAGGDEG